MATYQITGRRFNRQYVAGAPAPVYAALADATKIASTLCDVRWREVPGNAPAAFPAHASTSKADRLNVENVDYFDAAIFCTDHNSGHHLPRASAGCYRFTLPDAAIGKTLVSLRSSVFSDPYNSAGARVALYTSSSPDVPMDCAVCRLGSSPDDDAAAQSDNATDEAAATEWTSTNTHVSAAASRRADDGLWYGNQGVAVIAPSQGLTMEKYLFVFVALEDYALARNGYLEGSSYLLPVFTLETAEDIEGWLDGDRIDLSGQSASPEGKIPSSGGAIKKIISGAGAILGAAGITVTSLFLSSDVDEDGDGLPDAWVAESIALSAVTNLSERRSYAIDGDYMAAADVDRTVLIVDVSGQTNAYISSVAPEYWHIGDDVAGETLHNAIAYGDMWGQGRETTLASGIITAVMPAKVHLVHHQVYREFGFERFCATASPLAPHTKPFTALDKWLLARHFGDLGLGPGEEAVSNSVGYAAFTTLPPGIIDFDADGVADGWELYTMFRDGVPSTPEWTPWTHNATTMHLDVDGDSLSLVKEYDNGNDPTDPWNKFTRGNTIMDAYLVTWRLKGRLALRRDNDNDQLSNFMEFMISSLDGFPKLDAGRMSTYAEKFGGDQLVPDYFLRHGSLYLGEMFTDHDFIEDWYEDLQPVELQVGSTRVPNISRFRYDAAGDVDADGWSNWAEARAAVASPVVTITEVTTNGAAIATNVYETTEFALNGSRPTPLISFRLAYHGERASLEGKPVVVQAWRDERSFQLECDAKWYSNLVYSAQFPLVLGRPEQGYLRGGKNKFAAYVDVNEDGEYQPSEPYGVVENIDVDYAYGDSFVIELTDVNPSIIRVAIADAIAYQDTGAAELPAYDELSPQYQDVIEEIFGYMSASYTDRGVTLKSWAGITHPMYVGTNTHIAASNSVLVRVVRSFINGNSGESYSDDIVLERVMSFRHGTVLTEADVLDDGVLDLDWGTLLPASGLAAAEVSDVSYRIVFIDPNVADDMENNNLAVAFVNKFETQPYQTPTAPIEVKVSGSQPTFLWSHTNTIGKAYPAFQLKVWESDGETLVYDSGALRAPARDSGGVYSWTAPLYNDMMTGEGKVFSAESNYVWSVSMLDAKFYMAVDVLRNAATKKPFRLGGTSAAGGLADYGLIPVAVKYMGPGNVSTNTATDLIRVEAYTSPDFSGKPYGAAYVKHTDTLAASDVIELNAMVTGLPLGKSYYMLAYIDTNGNGVRDDWESWGYGNFVGTERKDVYTPRAYELAAKDVNDGTVPDCVVYIEDADTNDNKIPDVWEWNKDGRLGGDSVANILQVSEPCIMISPDASTMTRVSLSDIFTGEKEIPQWVNLINK